jgi:hypothetical protein
LSAVMTRSLSRPSAFAISWTRCLAMCS